MHKRRLIKHKVWIKLGEWENAIEQISAKPPSSDNFGDRVITYAGIDNWQAIHGMKNEFNVQDPIMQFDLSGTSGLQRRKKTH